MSGEDDQSLREKLEAAQAENKELSKTNEFISYWIRELEQREADRRKIPKEMLTCAVYVVGNVAIFLWIAKSCSS